MFRKPILLSLILCALAVGITLLNRAPAHAAAPFVVTTNVDAQDANPGDGDCASQYNGCTLRAAVAEVNAGKGTQIQLAADTFYTLSGGELHITSDVSIEGSGTNTVLDGQNATRLIRVSNDVTAAFYDLHLIHGRADKGGAVKNEGSYVWLERVKLSENSATKEGGAIHSNDLLVLKDVTVTHNTAGQLGGGIFNAGHATVASSTLDYNIAAQYHGGGIYGDINAYTEVINSTISTNAAGAHGGGIFNGINATAELYNATVVYNKADNENTNQGKGGGLYNFGGTFKLFNMLLAHNELENGYTDIKNDCGGTFSAHYTKVNTLTGCTVNNVGGSTSGGDPALAPLDSYGGMTQTHALPAGSSLIDKGDPNGCKSKGGYELPYDQRGYARSIDGNGDNTAVCDIGAYEFGPDNPQCSGKPAKPTLTKPSDGALKTKLKVRLDWDDANCATSYKVIIRRDAKKGPKVETKSGLTESKFKTKALTPGVTYFWRVKACNDAGCKGAKPLSFIVQ